MIRRNDDLASYEILKFNILDAGQHCVLRQKKSFHVAQEGSCTHIFPLLQFSMKALFEVHHCCVPGTALGRHAMLAPRAPDGRCHYARHTKGQIAHR